MAMNAPSVIAATGRQMDSSEALSRPSSAQSPISSEHIQAIEQARRQARKINRAAAVAAFSGWTTVVFAALTLLSGLFSLPALVLGIGLSIVAVIELRGSKALRQFDLTAPGRLGCNQFVFAAMLVAYSAWCIAQALWGPNPYEAYMSAGADVSNAIAPFAKLHTTITIAFYSAAILCSLIAQGCAAAYYFTRRRHMLDYLAVTPDWIVQMLRATA